MPRACRLLACVLLGLVACRGGVRSPMRMAAVRAGTPTADPSPTAPSAGPVAPADAVALLRCEYYQISDG